MEQLKLFKIEEKHKIEYPCAMKDMHLNKWRPGHHGHHIDEYHVVFIPEEMHNSVSHNLAKGTNMEIINTLAFKYLGDTPEEERNLKDGRHY